MAGRDLLIYVNIPFCTQKCSFCDWVQPISAPDLRLKPTDSRREAYIDALLTQIAHIAPTLAADGYTPKIVYFGGGTGTILTQAEVRAVKGAVDQHFDLSGIDEATIEGSPETVDDEKLETFLDVGFNRISLGIQSLNDERLRLSGRAHKAAQAAASVRNAAVAGFRDINIDLISGFPGETLDEFRISMEKVLELPFHHVSLYPYRPASNTAMRRQMRKGRTGKVDLDEQLAAYSLAAEMLPQAGFPEYLFGHFGYPHSRSDMAYFGLQMDWIGFGSGASSLYGQRMKENENGFLDRFIAAPTSFDCDVPATAPVATRHLLYEALTMPDGAVRRLWEERTGGTLDSALKQAPARQLIDYLKWQAEIKFDDDGVRIPADKIPLAYIKLLYLNTPQEGRTRVEARSLTGGM